MHKPNFTFLRRKHLESMFGVCRSSIYNLIANRLLPRPVSLGLRSVGWPSYEIEVIFAARVAGKSDDEIKALVSELEAARMLIA